jgi:hypothetical protein
MDHQYIDILFTSVTISQLIIHIQCQHTSENGFPNIVNNKELHILWLQMAYFSTKCIEDIMLNTTLVGVQLGGAVIDGNSLKNIKNTSIHYLDLKMTLDDIGCMYLAESKNLWCLEIKHISDIGAEYIAKSKSIVNLSIISHKITDIGCECLKHNTSIKILNISCEMMTNLGIKHLCENTNIRELTVVSPNITDDCLQYFLENDILTKVDLKDATITEETCKIIQDHVLKNKQRLGEYSSYIFVRSTESITRDIDKYIIDKYID